MDLERIYNKLDGIENKLDGHLERIAVLEVKHEEMSGRIKILVSLVIAGVSAAATAGIKWIIGLFPST